MPVKCLRIRCYFIAREPELGSLWNFYLVGFRFDIYKSINMILKYCVSVISAPRRLGAAYLRVIGLLTLALLVLIALTV